MKLPSEYLRAGSGSSEYYKEANIVEGNKKPFIGQSPDFAYPRGFPEPYFKPKPSGVRTYNESRGGGNAASIERFDRASVGVMGSGDQAVRDAVVSEGIATPRRIEFTPSPPPRKRKVIGARRRELEQEVPGTTS